MRANSVISKLTAPQRAYLTEREVMNRKANKELACLVQTDGWLYAQRVANEIQKEFECRPTDTNWHVYTTVQYALNQLFERIRTRAKTEINKPLELDTSILAEIKERSNANRSRRNTSKSGVGRRASTASKRGRTC